MVLDIYQWFAFIFVCLLFGAGVGMMANHFYKSDD